VTRCSSRAFTLVELLMGLGVTMIVVTLAVSQIARHQRAYRALDAAVDLRARLLDATSILTSELRSASVAGDGLLVAQDTAVEFYSAIGTSTLCASPDANTLILPPDSLPSGRLLSSWLVTPEAGDEVLIFADSVWQRAAIVSFSTIATSLACPASAGLLSAAEVSGSGQSYVVATSPSSPLAAHAGAPVRIVRLVRYSLYHAGDGKWYLGFRRCAGGCTPIQPVSGPYGGPASTPPLSLAYFARDGSPISGPGPHRDVARIELAVHAKYSSPFALPGMPTSMLTDSLTVTVAPRNAW
jgi:hypothetical protein